MAVIYLVDNRGIVYEKLAEEDGFAWLRRLDDGTLDTRPLAALVDYDPKPNPGEIWKANDTGLDVIIIAKNPAGGFWVLPRPDGVDIPAGGVVSLVTYLKRDMTPKVRRARRRGDAIPSTQPA